METVPDTDFMKQFSGSASANLVFVFAFMMFAGIRKLCARKSRCHSKFHSCCLDVDIQDQTLRNNTPVTISHPPGEV